MNVPQRSAPPSSLFRATTLAAIFARPTRADSRVWMEVNGKSAVFHRPHSQPETKKGAVDAARTLLVNAGIKP